MQVERERSAFCSVLSTASSSSGLRGSRRTGHLRRERKSAYRSLRSEPAEASLYLDCTDYPDAHTVHGAERVLWLTVADFFSRPPSAHLHFRMDVVEEVGVQVELQSAEPGQ